ncbi:hypothetical protein ElyMa_002458600 [Elysia marginata]|uniref:Uncharacterized protein n=1 Tax=Elysia marginata TaxID=1093978 RepID=A0AAV4GKP2_9GAST|nr:hypothetical protein ElyMa_002458600 [Elysia marginata]
MSAATLSPYSPSRPIPSIYITPPPENSEPPPARSRHSSFFSPFSLSVPGTITPPLSSAAEHPAFSSPPVPDVFHDSSETLSSSGSSITTIPPPTATTTNYNISSGSGTTSSNNIPITTMSNALLSPSFPSSSPLGAGTGNRTSRRRHGSGGQGEVTPQQISRQQPHQHTDLFSIDSSNNSSSSSGNGGSSRGAGRGRGLPEDLLS